MIDRPWRDAPSKTYHSPFLVFCSAAIFSLSSSLKATTTYAISTIFAINAAVAPAQVEFPANFVINGLP